MGRAPDFLMLLCTASLSACPSPDSRARPPAGSAAVEQLDPVRVPADLQHLVPLAREWGIGDDVDRNAKVSRSTPADRERLRAALKPYQTRITAWLDSFAGGRMSDEAAAFMYMQLALEEIPDP